MTSQKKLEPDLISTLNATQVIIHNRLKGDRAKTGTSRLVTALDPDVSALNLT